jgi:hypothetical protein
VLDLLELHGIGAVPIVNEQGRVVNIYSRSDITFLATAADPDSVLNNLDCKLCDILAQPGNEVSCICNLAMRLALYSLQTRCISSSSG